MFSLVLTGGLFVSSTWTMKKWMQGAAILSISAIIVKILGAMYRVPFQNMVGDQGFYMYQQVYPFIGIFVVWTSYGLSVALSKLLVEAKSENEKIHIQRASFSLLTIISITFFCLLFLSAGNLAKMMGDGNLALLLKVSSFIALLMPILTLRKAAFQASGNMTPIAYSQVLEQFIRVVIIVFGTYFALQISNSLYVAAAVATSGAFFGELSATIMLLIYGGWSFNKINVKLLSIQTYLIIKKLVSLSISVSISALILLLFQLVDSFTILNTLLASGMEQSNAMGTKGIYDRGQPLVQMGILLASTFSLSIVPLVAHKVQQNSRRNEITFVQLAMKVAILFGVAAAAGLVLIMPYVNEMLFASREGSFVLMIIVLQIIPLSIILPLSSVLQGYGDVKIPILFFVGGIIVKVIVNGLLLPIFGSLGAAIATNIGLLFIAFGLYFYARKKWRISFAPVSFYGVLLFATVTMVIGVFIVELLLDSFLVNTSSSRLESLIVGLTGVLVGILLFGTIILKSRIMLEKEWYLLPFGRSLAKLQIILTKKKVGV